MTAKRYMQRKAALRQKYIEAFMHVPTEMQLFKMTVAAGKFNRIMKQEGAA